jgi:hypothetical protein
MKRFEHEWIVEGFVEHRTFFTKGMFGGLAAYLFERQMLPSSGGGAALRSSTIPVWMLL